MSAYIINAICLCSKFPIMGWKWTSQDPSPIHVYHKALWESKFCSHFYKFFHGVMLPIHQIIFKERTPRIYKETNAYIMPIARWFGE